MVIQNETLLHEFRTKIRCELCGELSRDGMDPHHIFSRGSGRLDIRINLLALCRICHMMVHLKPCRHTLLVIVAKRERTTVDAIVVEIYRLRRLPKECREAYEAAS